MTRDYEERLANMVNGFWNNIERVRQEGEKEEIAEDPAKHKLTRMMSDGKPASYRYVRATNGKGQEIRFCWASHRNAAGYFLGWRETLLKKAKKDGTFGGRDQWIARKVRNKVRDVAFKRKDRLEEKHSANAPA